MQYRADEDQGIHYSQFWDLKDCGENISLKKVKINPGGTYS